MTKIAFTLLIYSFMKINPRELQFFFLVKIDNKKQGLSFILI